MTLYKLLIIKPDGSVNDSATFPHAKALDQFPEWLMERLKNRANYPPHLWEYTLAAVSE